MRYPHIIVFAAILIVSVPALQAECLTNSPYCSLRVTWDQGPNNYGDQISYEAHRVSGEYYLAVNDVSDWWGDKISSLYSWDNYPAQWEIFDGLECNTFMQSGSGKTRYVGDDDNDKTGSLHFHCPDDRGRTYFAFCEHADYKGAVHPIHLYKDGNSYEVVMEIRQLDSHWNDEISGLECHVNGTMPKDNCYWYFYRDKAWNNGGDPDIILKNNEELWDLGDMNDEITSLRLVLSDDSTPPTVQYNTNFVRPDVRVELIRKDGLFMTPHIGNDDVQLLEQDFEDPVYVGQPSLNDWTTEDLSSSPSGDFARAWALLSDLDHCYQNETPQLAFLDDGVVQACSEGTVGTEGHDYAVPGGFAVTVTEGCAGEIPDGSHFHNVAVSPPIPWPGGPYSGACLSFDVYCDNGLLNANHAVWHVRTTTDPSGIDGWTDWLDDGEALYGGPGYFHVERDLSLHLLPGCTYIQVAVGVMDVGHIWDSLGDAPTPGPYFDNIHLVARVYEGPWIGARTSDIFQDGFPANGTITGDPNDLDIRLDMAADIVGEAHPGIVPGDSAVFTIAALRPGAFLDETSIELKWVLRPNPRLNSLLPRAATSGAVSGTQALDDLGQPVPDRYWFDLPDEDFFFPGDVLHYYVYAEVLVGVDPVQFGTLPADLSGYGVFDDIHDPDVRFDSDFTVHGLPSLAEIDDDWQNGYTQPSMLFWNDYANRGGENEWYFALAQLGFRRHEDFDVYYTNAPELGVSNGLGSRTAASQLAGYNTMLYTCGDLKSFTMAGFDQQHDKSDDITRVDTWLLQGRKNLLLCGDDLAYDMVNDPGGLGAVFVNDWIGVTHVSPDVSPTLGGVVAPIVTSTHDSTLDQPRDFIAFGSCPSIHTFDEVQLNTGTIALAVFDGTDVPCVTYRYDTVNDVTVIYSAVDFSFWYTIGDGSTGSSRSQNLSAYLTAFLEVPAGAGIATGVRATPTLFARSYPNPFNPVTKIELNVPKAGNVGVRVYNLRGELVRTLLDMHMDVSDLVTLEWDGTDDRGADVASGVYFCETRTAGEVRINKLALVR